MCQPQRLPPRITCGLGFSRHQVCPCPASAKACNRKSPHGRSCVPAASARNKPERLRTSGQRTSPAETVPSNHAWSPVGMRPPATTSDCVQADQPWWDIPRVHSSKGAGPCLPQIRADIAFQGTPTCWAPRTSPPVLDHFGSASCPHTPPPASAHANMAPCAARVMRTKLHRPRRLKSPISSTQHTG